MEIAVGYVRLVADMEQAEKGIKEIEKEFSKATKDIRKELDKTEKSLKSVNSTIKATGKESKSELQEVIGMFSSMAKAAGNFATVFGAVMKSAGMIFRAFTAIITTSARIITSVFKGIYSAINGILAALSLLASAGGKALTTLINTFKGLIDITVEYLKVLKDLALSFMTLGKVAIGALRGLSKFLDDLTKKFVFVQLDIRYIIDQMKRFATIFGGAIVGATAASASFEEGFVKIRRVVDATASEFQVLNERIRDLASYTPTTAKGLAEIGFVAGQMGIEGVENIERFISVIDKLTQVTNIVGLEGAAAFSKLMVITNEPLDRMENLASAIVDLGRNFAVFEDEILDMSKVVAGSGAAIGMTVDQILALSAAMSAAGVRAERGGSAMSRIILEMAKASKSGGKELESFAEIAKMTTDNFKDLIDTTPEKAIQEFIDGLGEIVRSGGNWVEALENVGLSQIRVRDVILRLVNASGLMNDTLAVSAEAYDRAEALAKEFQVRVTTVWAQVQMLRSELMELVRVIGTPFLEVARKAVGILRVVGAVLKNIDPEKVKVVAGFMALGAAIFTLITALLMGIKAIFTMATGLTLLARLITFILPIIGIMTILNDIFGGFTVDNLIKQFKEFKDDTVILYETLKELYEDTRDWFQDAQIIAEWSDTISQAFDDINAAWERLKNNPDYGSFEFSLDLAEITTSAVSDMTSSLEGALRQLNTYLENNNVSVFNEKAMSQEMRDNKWIKIAVNIANILKSGFRIAFIELPTLMYNVLESSGLNAEAKRVGNLWWSGFKESVVSKLPTLFDSTTSRMNGMTDFVETMTIPDEWASNTVDKMRSDLQSQDMDPLWTNIITSGLAMGNALKSVVVAVFKRLPEAIEKAIDWESFWENRTTDAISKIQAMNAEMEKVLDKVIAWDPASGSKMKSNNPFIQSILDLGMTMFAIFSEALIDAIEYALKNTNWYLLISSIASSVHEGMRQGTNRILGIERTGHDWAEQSFPENLQESFDRMVGGGKAIVGGGATLGKKLWEILSGQSFAPEGYTPPPMPELSNDQRKIEEMVRAIAKNNNVNEDLAAAIARVETDFKNVNFTGPREQSYGPMQFNTLGKAAEDLKEYYNYDVDLSTVQGKIEAGVMYTKLLMEKYNGFLQQAVDKFDEIDNVYEAAVVLYRGLSIVDKGNLSDIDKGRLDRSGLSNGAIIPGFGGGDKIPAMLERGEAVVPARVVAGGIAEIENWFARNGVGYRTGVAALDKNLTGMGGTAKPVVVNSLISEDLIESLEGILPEGLIEEIAENTAGWSEIIVNFMGEASKNAIIAVERIGNTILSLLEPMLGKERTTKMRSQFEGFVDFLETLRNFADQYMPESIKQALGISDKEEETKESPEQKTATFMEQLRNDFLSFKDMFANVATLWENIAYILDEEADRTYQLFMGISNILNTLSGGNESVKVIDEALSGIRENFEELTGSAGLGRLAGGIAGARAFGNGGNIVGGITGALAGAGIINPMFAVASNLIGGMVKREEVDPNYTALREQANAVNEQLASWDQSFRASKPTKKNTANWFEKLFGGKEWSYKGMDKSKASIEKAQEILQRLESLLSTMRSAVSDAFSADTFKGFVDSLGQSLYQTVRNSLVQAFLQTAFMKDKLKEVAKVIESGIKTDSSGRPYMSEDSKKQLKQLLLVIKNYSEPFYAMLSDLEIAGYDAADALETMTEQLKNVPQVFKVSLERWRAISTAAGGGAGTPAFEGDNDNSGDLSKGDTLTMPEKIDRGNNSNDDSSSNEEVTSIPINTAGDDPDKVYAMGSVQSAATGGEVLKTGVVNVHKGEDIVPPGKGGNVYQFIFRGPVYGIDNLKDAIKSIMDDIGVENGMSSHGVSRAGRRRRN